MHRFFYLWLLCTLTITLLLACTLSRQEEPAAVVGVELVAANVTRSTPASAAEPLAALVQGNNAFAADLYRLAAGDEQNLIFSPYSISLAFSMAYAGARGETAVQMQDALHFLDQARQHNAFNGLERHLAALDDDHLPDERTGAAFQLDVANALWGQRGAPFDDDFLHTLAAQYGAGLNVVDFSADPEAARQAINAWIAQATGGRIEDMLAPGAVSPQTRLALANAVYFYGAWQQPFEPSDTADGPFRLLDGSDVTVPLMHSSWHRLPYMEGDGFRALMLPFTGGEADMLLMLPDEGQFAALQQAVSADLLARIAASAETHDVTLTLPRFAFDAELDLAQALPRLGLAAPFGPDADFSGILPGGGLSIGTALHQATIAVDELGAEATAATIIEIEVSEMPRADFHATRPFLFAIVERETGTILFLGHLLNPTPAR